MKSHEMLRHRAMLRRCVMHNVMTVGRVLLCLFMCTLERLLYISVMDETVDESQFKIRLHVCVAYTVACLVDV